MLSTIKSSVYSEDHERFRALLRQVREEAGLTQQQVADALGKPQPFVSKYEWGERRLDVVELAEIGPALGTTLDKFVKRMKA